MTLESHYRKSYGDSYNKLPPDMERCCEEIMYYVGNWPHSKQCSRKRGHGPDGAYCRQHDPEVAARRRAETDARERDRHRRQRLEWAGPRFYAALKAIADGHNDPRALARETIRGYGDD